MRTVETAGGGASPLKRGVMQRGSDIAEGETPREGDVVRATHLS